MRKGTTPTLTFKLPVSISTLKTVKVSICQGEIALYKYLSDLTIVDEYTLKLSLTQKETFMFDDRNVVKIQLRVLTNDGIAPPTPIFTERLDKCLDDEVLV